MSAQAQQTSGLEPRVFDDVHNSEYGHFSHWSAVVERGANRLMIEYALCNIDERGLIYTWRGPNITAGDGGTLPPGKCHILSRDVAAVEHNRRAVIAFTQAGRNHDAPAHVSKLSVAIPTERLPPFLENRLRSFFGAEGTPLQPSLADLAIVQRREDGVVHHSISWFPPTVALAIGADAFGDSEVEAVTSAINDAGFAAEPATLEKVMAESGWSFLPSETLQQDVIVVTALANSPNALAFTIEGNATSIAQSYVTLIDSETRRLITGFAISAFGPQQ
jgi:hypothetical protein